MSSALIIIKVVVSLSWGYEGEGGGGSISATWQKGTVIVEVIHLHGNKDGFKVANLKS
jgi:hypothetical protein